MRTHRIAFISIMILAVAGVACSERGEVADSGRPATTASAPGGNAACTPLETRGPNAAGQRPAFDGQTRACAIKSNVTFDVRVLAKGLEQPWAVEPLPGGDLLITQKSGHLRIISAAGALGEPIAGASYIRLREFLIGTAIGITPGVALRVIFVDRADAAINHPGLDTFALLAAVTAILVGGALYIWRRFGGEGVT